MRDHDRIWIGFLFLADAGFCFALWLMDNKAFLALSGCAVLGSAFLFATVLVLVRGRQRKRQEAFVEFLEDPDTVHEERLLLMADRGEQESLRLLGKRLRDLEERNQGQEVSRREQEEYVEAWAHEIKNAVSLMNMLLGNRREEMSETVYKKMEYARNQIQGYVEQMLCYERLQAEHKDYIFERISLEECCTEVLEEYQSLLDEKGFEVEISAAGFAAVSDRKGLSFILGQAVSNALKYTREEARPFIRISAEEEENGVRLIVEDHGIGVRKHDLPFLFDKGFVGDIGENRKRATGMGLYLARQIARDLRIQIEARSKYREGFEFILHFPESDGQKWWETETKTVCN